MIVYRAAWVLPITGPPISDAGVSVDADRIVGIHKAPFPASAKVLDLGHAALLPGLVNAHTHLELSWLRGRVAPRARFIDWVRDLVRLRRDEAPSAVREAMSGALAEVRSSGTALVGDISNTLASVKPLLDSRIGGVVFREVIGFQRSRADEVFRQAVADLDAAAWTTSLRGGLAAHAPYSVSAPLFQSIVRSFVKDHVGITSVHLAESAEEVEFVRTGDGPWKVLLEELNVWDPSWETPRCGPVEYVDRLGYLRPGTLAVHGVQTTHDDLATLKRREVTLVTCPRSNLWTGAGTPPLHSFFEAGVRVAIGTDSLASAPDLNLFSELAEARRLAPGVTARDLLRAATLNGAQALGFGTEHGSIEPGKRAALIAVDGPPAGEDVEEYLVSGVTSSQVRWVTEYSDV
ncbi:MAG: amidohydrolase family protein [Acidobacteria bacterium]|nr:amidohydrolase family protein [Acidobacteriota bacterium]